MKPIHLALLACLLPSANRAFADTVFNLSGRLETDTYNDHSGDYDHDAALTGTLTLNSAGTAFDAVNLHYNLQFGPQNPESIPITFNSVQRTYVDPAGVTRVRLSGMHDELEIIQELDLPTTQLSTYAGGNLCGLDFGFQCGANSNSAGSIYILPGFETYGYSFLESGSLSLANPTPDPPPVPSGVTPEPTSIALVGTGLLGIVGAVRRRLFS